MLYKEWLNEWLELYVKAATKERTYRKYRQQAEKYILPALGNYDVNALSAVELQKFSVSLSEYGLAPNSINFIIAVLRSSLKKGVQLGIIDRQYGDAIVRPRIRANAVSCFTKEEQKKIESYIFSHDKPYLFGILLALYTGLRIGELLALTWADVDLQKGIMSITKSCYDKWENNHYIKAIDTTKTKSSERMIPIPRQIILLSIVVIVLTFCMPVKSFDNYSGWLYTTIFAADCLSAIAVVVMWIVLSKANKNPCFNGFGIGDFGSLACISGVGVGVYVVWWSCAGSLEWWWILVFVVVAASFLFSLICGLIKHKGKCIPRFLLICLVGVFFGSAAIAGEVAFLSFAKSTHDYYTENSDGTYTYIICDRNTEKLEIPSEYCEKPVTAVSRDAHIELSRLKSVSIPDSVTSIGWGVFAGCSRLESITVPYVGYSDTSTVTGYDGEVEFLRPIGYLFGSISYDGGIAVTQDFGGIYISGDKTGKESYYWSSTFYIPASLKHVTVLGGEVCFGVFYGCTNLESVTLGDGVTSIGQNAFLNCGAVHKTKGISYIDKWIVGCDSTEERQKKKNDGFNNTEPCFAHLFSYSR